MIEPPPYPEEEKRREALNELGLLDTPIEERFERVTRRVCQVFDVPIALFNLIDADRQYYKSVQGLNATTAPLAGAFCTHALHEKDIMVVPNARLDKRFNDNPDVTGGLHVGFYAACPVRSPQGLPVGTLCAIDTKPRNPSEEQLASLRDLTDIIEREIQIADLSKTQAVLKLELTRARRLAMTDPVTRLWNRDGILEVLKLEWEDAKREARPLSLVIADIDRFMAINGMFGAPAADTILRSVGKSLLQALRGEDAVGRLENNNFVLIIRGDASEALRISQEIHSEISQRPISMGQFSMGGAVVHQSYPVTLSIGTATTTLASGTTDRELFASAEKALKTAKTLGGNQVSQLNLRR